MLVLYIYQQKRFFRCPLLIFKLCLNISKPTDPLAGARPCEVTLLLKRVALPRCFATRQKTKKYFK